MSIYPYLKKENIKLGMPIFNIEKYSTRSCPIIDYSKSARIIIRKYKIRKIFITTLPDYLKLHKII